MRHQPGIGFTEPVVQLPQHIDPDLDVLPLRLTHLPFGGRWKMTEVPVLDADQI